VAAEIVEQVRLLDGLVRYRFGNNAALMGAWASAWNVRRSAMDRARFRLLRGEGFRVIREPTGFDPATPEPPANPTKAQLRH